MISEKSQKRRKKEIKKILKLVEKINIGNVSENTILKVALDEATINYIIGSNHSSQIMATVFIEKLLKVHFKKKYDVGSLDKFLNKCNHENWLDKKMIAKIDSARKAKNVNSHDVNDLNAVLPIFNRIYGGNTSAGKNAKKALKLCIKLYEKLIVQN